MGGLSSQTFALFLVLTPGFLFFAGAYVAPNPYATRFSMQRGLVLDTAVFVVTSAALHMTVGLIVALLLDWMTPCAVIDTFAHIIGLTGAGLEAGQCSVRQEIFVAFAYFAVLSASAFVAGRVATMVIARSPRLFTALNGPYYDVARGEGLVIANVLTKTSHEGRSLVYEGVLIELALTGSKSINYVCLEAAQRFYMNLGKDAPRTTTRHQFQSIDKNSRKPSRITIPGDQIANFVTRTYPTIVPSAAISDLKDESVTRRALVGLRSYFGRRRRSSS